MNEIQPVSIWYNGVSTPATVFNFYGISDNLSTSATFYFALFAGTVDELGAKLADGNLVMDGADYTSYSSSPDSNTFATNWGAGKLNITLI